MYVFIYLNSLLVEKNWERIIYTSIILGDGII